MFLLLISNSLEVSLHPGSSRMQPVYSLWGFPAPPSMFPLRSVLFPRPTRIPEHGSLVCQVQTCSLSLLLSPAKTQERYLSNASVCSSQKRGGPYRTGGILSNSFCMENNSASRNKPLISSFPSQVLFVSLGGF